MDIAKRYHKEADEAREKYSQKQNPSNKRLTLDDAFNKAKQKDPKLTYDKIYNSEAGKAVTKKYLKEYGDKSFEEDPDYYRDIETAYYKKLGLL